MFSPRSRGKGSRRVPWRDGGKGKRKVAAWRKQAVHSVDDLAELPGELVALRYVCPADHTAAESIYLFDQRIAHTGIRYHAELHGTRHWPVFTIRVSADQGDRVSVILAQMGKR